jgi:1-acyl-sn-glycerol-3-phosphate acyltransferase
MKFHSGILAQVLDAGGLVTAAYVRYRFNEDNGPDVSIEEDLAYWRDVGLFAHIFHLLSLRGIEVQVRIADAPIAFSGGAGRRKLAAAEARTAVMALGGLGDPVAAG